MWNQVFQWGGALSVVSTTERRHISWTLIDWPTWVGTGATPHRRGAIREWPANGNFPTMNSWTELTLDMATSFPGLNMWLLFMRLGSQGTCQCQTSLRRRWCTERGHLGGVQCRQVWSSIPSEAPSCQTCLSPPTAAMYWHWGTPSWEWQILSQFLGHSIDFVASQMYCVSFRRSKFIECPKNWHRICHSQLGVPQCQYVRTCFYTPSTYLSKAHLALEHFGELRGMFPLLAGDGQLQGQNTDIGQTMNSSISLEWNTKYLESRCTCNWVCPEKKSKYLVSQSPLPAILT